MNQDPLQEKRFRATNYFVQAGNSPRPAVTEQQLRESLLRWASTPMPGDFVAGKGPITGHWYTGKFKGPARFRDESIVESTHGVIHLKTSTLKVLEAGRAE